MVWRPNSVIYLQHLSHNIFSIGITHIQLQTIIFTQHDDKHQLYKMLWYEYELLAPIITVFYNMEMSLLVCP